MRVARMRRPARTASITITHSGRNVRCMGCRLLLVAYSRSGHRKNLAPVPGFARHGEPNNSPTGAGPASARTQLLLASPHPRQTEHPESEKQQAVRLGHGDGGGHQVVLRERADAAASERRADIVDD